MKIAIYCPNWVGDLVMATPTLRAMRTQFPRAEIVAVLRPYVADVLTGTGLVDRMLLHQPRGGEPSQRGWNFLSRLRREQFDLALLLPNSWRSAWLAWASGAQRRVGFNRNGRGWMLTDSLQPKPRTVPHPVLDEYLRLAGALGCKKLSRRMVLATTEADEAQLDAYWKKQGVTPERVVCFNTGGAFGAAKDWPLESFVELARIVARRFERHVLVLCGPSERDRAREIARLANHPAVTSLAEEPLSLGLTKAAVRRAELLVTTDSGPRHFAAAFGVPVVTIFGPTHQAWSETYFAKNLPVQLDLECGPCQQRVCPLGHHHCMTQLSVERVLRAVTYQLTRHATPIAA